MAKGKQSFAQGAFVLTVALVIAKVVGAAYRLILYNIIGTTGVGAYVFAYNLYTTVYAVAVTGFPTAVAKIVAGYAAEGRYQDVRRTVRVSGMFFAAIGLVSSGVAVAIARPYTASLPGAYYSILAFAPSLLFSGLMAAHRGYHQGLANMTPTAVSQVIEVLVKALTGLAGAYVASAWFGKEYAASGTVMGVIQQSSQEAAGAIGILSAAGGMLGVTLSTLVGWLFFVLLRLRKGDDVPREQPNSIVPDSKATILKKILAIGVPIALSSVTVSLAGMIDNLSVLDRLAYGLEKNATAFFAAHGGLLEQAVNTLAIDKLDGGIPGYLYGAYGIGSPLFSLIPTITGAFGMSVLPHIASAWQRRDTAAIRDNVESSLKLTMLVAAPAGFGISALAGPIARMLFTSDPIATEITVPILTVLGVAAIFVSLSGLLNSALQAVGRVDVPVKLMLIGGVIKLVSNYLLVGIPSLNIKAAPVGNLLCYLIITCLGLVILLHTTGARVNLMQVLAKPLFAGFCTGVFAKLAYNLVALTGRTKVATLMGVAAGVAVYLVLIGILKMLTKEDVLAMPAGKKLAAILEKLHVLG